MKKYIILIGLLFGLLFVLSTVNKVAEPYKELSKLPRCSNDVIVTDGLRSAILNKSNSIIETGTGKDYFVNHYQFTNIDYHLTDCTFSVNYEYFYEGIHETMSIVIKAFNESNLETNEVNALIRPVQITINSTEAEQIAFEKGIRYDYYRREISTASQTIYYRFYQESLTEGTQIVFELDAQSKEITQIQNPEKFVPLV